MHPQFNSSYCTRKFKTGIMHVLDLFKAHQSSRKNKSTATKRKVKATQSSTQKTSPSTVYKKQPLERKLTAEEISDAELALERLRAEKRRLEELLNSASDRHLLHTKQAEETSNNNNVRKELVRVPRYQQKVAFKLHNVFTSEECDQLLAELEQSEDCVSTETSEVFTTHSETMAKRLWPVLQNEVPKTLMGNTLLGLSNRCILESHSEGYSRKAKMDEAYEPIEGKEKSFLSVYVFLNDDYEGGQSSFLKNWQPSVHDVQVKPQKGSIFVHQHNLLHEVTPITHGEKHIVRFDVMYNTSKRDILSEMYD